jgi:hypothetical protein
MEDKEAESSKSPMTATHAVEQVSRVQSIGWSIASFLRCFLVNFPCEEEPSLKEEYEKAA